MSVQETMQSEPEDRDDEIAQALKAQLAKHLGPNGVMMDSSSWRVTAINPG